MVPPEVNIDEQAQVMGQKVIGGEIGVLGDLRQESTVPYILLTPAECLGAVDDSSASTECTTVSIPK
jgi:hypothetical protein